MSEMLRVENLNTYFDTRKGLVKAVDGISFSVDRGEILGIVGESGAGKSITGFSLINLIDSPGEIVAGSILFDGRDLVQLSEDELSKIRGGEISMIFQDPQMSLNPVITIGKQLIETVTYHNPETSKQTAYKKAVEMLELVGMPAPEKRMSSYPHQLSGGMKQRVVIAMALINSPKLLIADEPTTALDVTIQAQIFELMQRLKEEHQTAIILITHDMGVIAELADDVAVMYMGSIVEKGTVDEVLRNPAHPYTKALLQSIPILGQGKKQKIEPIRGATPDPYMRPKGCQFIPRCDYAVGECNQFPEDTQISDSHYAKCWKSNDVTKYA